MVKVQKYKDFAAISAPCRIEGDIPDLIVEGDIPPEIDGTFYRVMQDPFYDHDYFQDGKKSTPFDGDGNVSAFRIKNGVVSYKQRYVYTERLVAERKAGRSLFGLLNAPFTHHPCVQSLIASPANTNVIIHNGKLLALQEAGPPYELNPVTLATVGHEPFKGEYPKNRPFTAHPKVDPETGELLCYGYQLSNTESKDFAVVSIDKNGKKLWERKGEAPTNGPFHDMVMTPNYVVLIQMPLITDLSDVYSDGKSSMSYDPKCPAWFGVIPRNNPDKAIRWFRWKNCMNIHSGCSWEENDKIYFDCTRAHSSAFTFLPTAEDDSNTTAGKQNLKVDFVKWKIDLNSDSDVLNDPKVLVDVPCEFPRTDERFLGKKANISFLACFTFPESGKVIHQGLNALARFNLDKNKLDVFDPGNSLVQEPAFIPRSPKAPEGDGYIIVMVDNLDQHRNDLLIIDTEDFHTIKARIQLPLRLRSAVHGNWVDQERIPGTDNFVQPLPNIYDIPLASFKKADNTQHSNGVTKL